MRTSTRLVALVGAASFVFAACSGGTATTAPASEAPASEAPASEAPATEAPATEAPPTSDMKIGVVTDVGAVNDKNFNQYSYAGAVAGARAIGAKTPSVVVPKEPSDYERLINAYIDQGFDVIVGVGFNLESHLAKAAKTNPDTWFVGVDANPCINKDGDVDSTFTDCSGVIADLLPNFITLNYAEDQAGYLAGMVAASASKSGIIGAIGGVAVCAPCVRYIQGYALGAKAVNPDIKVFAAWVSASDFVKGFYDQTGGTTYAQQFIKQHPGIDVLFQVAGQTGNGVIDAACAAGINAIGVDVDQYQSYPASQACILTSAEKHLTVSVSTAIQKISDQTAKGGRFEFNATNDGIGASPFYEAESKLPSDMQAKVTEAIAAMAAGTLVTCPADACGKTPAPPIGD